MMPLWIYVFVTIIVAVYVKLKFFKSRTERMLLKFPGPDYNLLIGNARRYFVPREDLFIAMRNTWKEFSEWPLVRIWIGSTPRILLTKAESVEGLLTSTRLLDKSVDYDFLSRWLGRGLLTSTGAKWHSRRKLLTPTFHFRILEEFLVIMNEQANILIEDVLMKKSDGQIYDIYGNLCRCSLDIICETAMGVKLDSQHDSNSDYVRAVSQMAEIAVQRTFNIFLHAEFIYNLTSYAKRERRCLDILHSFTKRVIENRKMIRKLQQTESNGEENDAALGVKQRLAFLDLLLTSYDKGDIDDAGVQEEVDTFMFEGHDTTAAGLTWSIYNLGRHPELQAKVYEEILDEVGDSNNITTEQLNRLKYLERFIKESMRLFPPVPFYVRRLKEDAQLADRKFPSGCLLVIIAPAIHTDPHHWPNPFDFDPDRFLPENSVNRSPFAYVPFSAGPRNCIGQRFAMMELKVIVAKVVQNFEIHSIDKEEDIKCYSELVLRPVKGLRVQLKKR